MTEFMEYLVANEQMSDRRLACLLYTSDAADE